MAEVLAAVGVQNEETIKKIQQIMLNIGKEEVVLRLYKHGVVVNDVFKTNKLTEDEIENFALDVLYDCIIPKSRVFSVPANKETGGLKTAIILLKFTQHISAVCSGVQRVNLKIAVLSATLRRLSKDNLGTGRYNGLSAGELIERVLHTTEAERLMAVRVGIGHRIPVPCYPKSESDEIDEAIKILEDLEDG